MSTTSTEIINNQRVIRIHNFKNYMQNVDWTSLCYDTGYIGFTNLQKAILCVLDSYRNIENVDFILFDNLNSSERYIFYKSLSELPLPIPFLKFNLVNNGILEKSICINTKKIWIIPTLNESKNILPIYINELENYYTNIIEDYCNSTDNLDQIQNISYNVYNKEPVPFILYKNYLNYMCNAYQTNYNEINNMSLIIKNALQRHTGLRSYRSTYLHNLDCHYNIMRPQIPGPRGPRGPRGPIIRDFSLPQVLVTPPSDLANVPEESPELAHYINNIIDQASFNETNSDIRKELSDLIFDIRLKLTDFEYKTIMDTLSKMQF